MSHLGLQILYSILNDLPEVACERCYAPWPDMERNCCADAALPLCSLESQRPLAAFDIVGFSLQYELSYTNVLMMLELGGIPLHREDRDEGHPLVIAGGPSAFNPAPMSAFIDAFVIGEGEEVVGEIAASVIAVRSRGGKRREQLEALAGIAGVYVPAVHTGGERIAKRIITDLDAWRLPLCPVVPLMKTIHDRVTLEIARGCTRGCRFCQAGMVWRPVRERTPAVLEEMAEAMLRATGHDEISLLSLSSGDYTLIEPLLKTLMDRYYAQARRPGAPVAPRRDPYSEADRGDPPRPEDELHPGPRGGNATTPRHHQQGEYGRGAPRHDGAGLRGRLEGGEALLHARPSRRAGRGSGGDRRPRPSRPSGRPRTGGR